MMLRYKLVLTLQDGTILTLYAEDETTAMRLFGVLAGDCVPIKHGVLFRNGNVLTSF